MPDIGGKCWPITALQCADWLDKKYARHHEEEDKAGAAWLRYYAGNAPPSAAGEFVPVGYRFRDKNHAAEQAVLLSAINRLKLHHGDRTFDELVHATYASKKA